MADNKVKFLRGTAAEYAASTKDNDTFYYITDTKKLYLGANEVTGGNITIDNVLSDTSENPVQNKVIKGELDKKGTYSKPTDGIPKADLASAVQSSLDRADNALPLLGNATSSNKLSSNSYATITLEPTSWQGNVNTATGFEYYFKTITIDTPMLYTNFIFDVVLSSDQSAAKLQLESWNYIMADGMITQTTSNGSTTAFTFKAFTTKPTVELIVAIQGVS